MLSILNLCHLVSLANTLYQATDSLLVLGKIKESSIFLNSQELNRQSLLSELWFKNLTNMALFIKSYLLNFQEEFCCMEGQELASQLLVRHLLDNSKWNFLALRAPISWVNILEVVRLQLETFFKKQWVWAQA